MKKLFQITLLLFIFSLPVFAVTASPSATPTENIDKIKNLVKENLQETENTLSKNLLTGKLIGQTGLVKTVGVKNLNLETDKDLLQVLISDTTSITKNNQDIKTNAIAIGDKLLIIGQKNKEAVLEAKLINVLPETKEEEIVFTKTIISPLTNIDLKKKTFTLQVDSKDTIFTLSKKSTVKLEDFQNGDLIMGISKKYQGKYSLSRAVKL